MKSVKDLFWFKRGAQPQTETSKPQPLRIEGVPDAPLTAEPDDAEIAAQAVLELMSERPTPGPSLRGRGVNTAERKSGGRIANADTHGDGIANPAEQAPETLNLKHETSAPRDARYYHALADRIREGHEQERRKALRCVAYAEQELRHRHLPADACADIERRLYRHLDTIEREQGTLKRRWQHCLATVTVRLMQHTESDGGDAPSASQPDTPSALQPDAPSALQPDAPSASGQKQQTAPPVTETANDNQQNATP